MVAPLWYHYYEIGGVNMTDKIEVKLRLPQQVKDKLYEEAGKQNRSVNNLLEQIIGDYLKKQK